MNASKLFSASLVLLTSYVAQAQFVEKKLLWFTDEDSVPGWRDSSTIRLEEEVIRSLKSQKLPEGTRLDIELQDTDLLYVAVYKQDTLVQETYYYDYNGDLLADVELSIHAKTGERKSLVDLNGDARFDYTHQTGRHYDITAVHEDSIAMYEAEFGPNPR